MVQSLSVRCIYPHLPLDAGKESRKGKLGGSVDGIFHVVCALGVDHSGNGDKGDSSRCKLHDDIDDKNKEVKSNPFWNCLISKCKRKAEMNLDPFWFENSRQLGWRLTSFEAISVDWLPQGTKVPIERTTSRLSTEVSYVIVMLLLVWCIFLVGPC